MPSGLKNKITDQNTYLKNPLQKSKNTFENILDQIGLFSLARRFLTEAMMYAIRQ